MRIELEKRSEEKRKKTPINDETHESSEFLLSTHVALIRSTSIVKQCFIIGQL